MDMSRKVAQQCKENVDTQVNSTSLNQEDSEGRNENLQRRKSTGLEGGEYSDDNDENSGCRHVRFEYV